MTSETIAGDLSRIMNSRSCPFRTLAASAPRAPFIKPSVVFTTRAIGASEA